MTTHDLVPREPLQIGPYRVLGLLGRGGMGVVYRGEHVVTRAAAAIKVVRAGSNCDLAALRREIEALRKLDHPGIVRITDHGVTEGVPWYAMDYLRGETLAAQLERSWGEHVAQHPARATRPARPRNTRTSQPSGGPSDPTSRHAAPMPEVALGRLPWALTVAHRLCTTLSFVHGEGIVHRDLKSTNVLLCDGDAPKLVDFGLVWRFPGGHGREVLDDVSDNAVGTAGYMAPEQILGHFVDARADLYALGCVLYELLTGRLPFSGRSAAELHRLHLAMPPLPPSAHVRSVPFELDQLVLTLLAKRPEQRFGHATEVARQLAGLGALASAGAADHTLSYVYRAAIVGRDAQLSSLDGQLERALAGDGGITLVSGESGVGKTYFAMSVARAALGRGAAVFTGSSLPLGSAGASADEGLLHPFRGVLRAIADRCLMEPAQTEALLGPRAQWLAACEPSLTSLPGLPEHIVPQPLPAHAARQRLLAALADTLAAFTERQPVVLLLDDLQWADEATFDFLVSLPTAWFAGKQLAIVGLYRTDEPSPALRALLARPGLSHVALDRLHGGAVHELVRGMLAMDAPPARFVALIASHSEGNPFFVAEYLRTAVAEGLLVRRSTGQWHIDERLVHPDRAALPLPRTLFTLVARRLDGLAGDERAVLDAAAVLGRDVDEELLRALLALDEARLWAAVRALIARQIFEEPGSAGLCERAPRVRFIHDKLREIAYAQVAPDALRTLHGAAARALLHKLEGTRELVHAFATLAHHHQHGGEAGLAVDWLERAGEQALGSYSNRDAVRHFSAALALDAAPEHARFVTARQLRRVRWQRRLAEAHYALGDLESVDRHLAEALREGGHPLAAAQPAWLSQLARDVPEQLFHRLREPALRSATRGERGHSTMAPQSLEAELSRVMHHLAERHYFNSRALPMISASLCSVNLAERAGSGMRPAAPYAMLGMAAGLSRLPGLGRRYFGLARKAATESRDDAGLSFSLYAAAAWRIGDGAWDEVRALCHEGLVIAERIHDLKSLGMAKTLLAHAHFYTGRFQDSATLYAELESDARRTGDAQHLSWGLYAGARARIALGELTLARPMLEEASALLEGLVEVPSKIITPGLLTSLHLKQGALLDALAAAEQTVARIRCSLPTVFATVAGYGAVVEAYVAAHLHHTERGDQAAARAARRRAQRALLDLLALSINVPIAQPTYLRLKGALAEAHALRGFAHTAYARACDSAARLGMPYEEGLGHLAAAQLRVRAGRTPGAHRARACTLFAALGATHELAQARAL